MGHINIVSAEEVGLGEFPGLAGLSAQGSLQTRAMIHGPDRPLWLWMHELKSGASIQWNSPNVGHVLHVWKGAANVGGRTTSTDAVICIEHGANAVVQAGENGATLLHYHSRIPHPMQDSRPGGHVHVSDRDGLLKVKNEQYDVTTTFWLDSQCPNCELWLHKSEIVNPRPQSLPHFHPEDEIIFVVKGGMIVGRRILKPGTALAVDANTTYAFGVDQGGLAFTNFRPIEPHYVMMSRDGPMHAPYNEREQMSIGTVIPTGA
ncbi:MAG: cupin domain-containing protein [Betaproteobacteria bacterium]|nr:cupin domain-containing protein [Betaproteobacteria bacterium]